jgi:hypothetical protein
MIKLTRYTNIKDLKAAKNSFQPQKSDSERESDLKELVDLIKNHSLTPERSKSDNSVNHSSSEK